MLAVKHGAHWAMRDWSLTSKVWVAGGILVAALAAVGWDYLLRPALLKRQQRREDPGMRELAVRDRARDR